MSQKTSILTFETESVLKDEKKERYTKYAKEHHLKITGELHCPALMLFVDPEHIVKEVMKMGSEVIIVDEVEFLMANAYHDGQLVKMFEEQDIDVISTKLPMSFSDFNQMIDDESLKELKETVHKAISETFQKRENKVAILTVDSSKDELIDFIKRLQEENNKVSVIDLPAFDPRMSDQIDFCIRDSDINKVVVFDQELLTSSMKQYLFKLQTKENVEICFMKEHDMDNEQSLQHQEMMIH